MGSKATTPRLKVSSELGDNSFRPHLTSMTAWAPFRLPSRCLGLERASGRRVVFRDRGARFRCMGRTFLVDSGDLALGVDQEEEWSNGAAVR